MAEMISFIDQLLRVESPRRCRIRRSNNSPPIVGDKPNSDTREASTQTNIQSKTSDTPSTSTQTDIQTKDSEPRSDYFWTPEDKSADFHEDEEHATARILSDNEIMMPSEEMKTLRLRLYHSQFNESNIRALTAKFQRLEEKFERDEAMRDRLMAKVETLLELVDKEMAKVSRMQESTGNTSTTRLFGDERLAGDTVGGSSRMQEVQNAGNLSVKLTRRSSV